MYHPQQHYEYSDVGMASWYGKRDGFHGKKTATGEVFNTHRLTAAHKTLPLPSVARVTNLENGRSIIVKVNDRGPFKPGRIVDVSEKGAQLLGFYRKGTARVRVDSLVRESLALNQSPGRELPVRYASASSVPVRAPFRERKLQKKKRRNRILIPPPVPGSPPPRLAMRSVISDVHPSATQATASPIVEQAPLNTQQPEGIPLPHKRPAYPASKEVNNIPTPVERPHILDTPELAGLKQELKKVAKIVVPEIPERKLRALARKLLDEVY